MPQQNNNRKSDLMTPDNKNKILREIPSMDRLLRAPQIAEYEKQLGHANVKALLAELLCTVRGEILSGERTSADSGEIAARALSMLASHTVQDLRTVVNATGVVLHTNLGRSPIAAEAAKHACDTAASYSTLEYSLENGRRGSRNDHVERLICRLTGAESALVVNNNAAAVILCLTVLAKDRESIVSRGELVEIGGSFRIPEIMELSGTKLVEVGATNRTHLRDYERAITDNTAVLLKVHPSNYRVVGFHSEVPREELASLAHRCGLILMEDLGSGLLVDAGRLGLLDTEYPTVADSLKAGCNIVTFSGDKLLGGPQAGVIAGRKDLIGRLRTYPLTRALRVGKMTLAALETTLRIYLRGDELSIPAIEMLSKREPELLASGRKLLRKIRKVLKSLQTQRASAELIPAKDAAGGGAFPQSELPGFAVALDIPEAGGAGKTAELLRRCPEPVIAVVSDDMVLLHIRTLRPGDDVRITSAITHVLDTLRK